MIASLVLLLILPLGHDLWFHIYRIGTMASQLKKEPWRIPIRMLADSFNGYGYGAALYYGDLFLYIPAVLVCLGLNEVMSYKLFVVMILWGTFGIAYYSVRLLNKREDICLYFAYIYTFSAGCLSNLCIRSSVGESLALMCLPLVVGSFVNIIYGEKRRKNWLLLAVSMSGIALSHMLTLLLTTFVLCIWCLIEIKEVLVGKKVLEILKAAALMIGLSASFLFPMFEQMLYQKVQTPGNNDFQKQAFMEYSVDWIDYLIPYEVKKILVSLFSLSWDIEYWHPGAIGLFVILLIVTGIVVKPRFNKKQMVVAVSSIVCLLLLAVKPAMNIAKEFMAFTQFPWRILPLITLGLSFCGIWTIENAGCDSKIQTRVQWTMLIGTLLIAGMVVGPRYAYQVYVQWDDYAYVRENNPEFYHKYQIRYDKNAADALYLPEGVSFYMYTDRGEIVVANREGIRYQWRREKDEIKISIEENPSVDGVLELPLYMYKGYVAESGTGEFLPVVKSENGLVSVEIEDFIGDIRVWYRGTMIQKISDMITFLSILLSLWVWRKQGEKKI